MILNNTHINRNKRPKIAGPGKLCPGPALERLKKVKIKALPLQLFLGSDTLVARPN